VPVVKRHDGKITEIQNPRDHLTVYRITPKAYELKRTLKNQFGKWEVVVTRSVMLAVPSQKLKWTELK